MHDWFFDAFPFHFPFSGVKLEVGKLQVLDNFDKIIIALPYLINVIPDI